MPTGYQGRDMSEAERRRRAAARIRRRRRILRNRIIFAVGCLAVLAPAGFGVFKLVKFVQGKGDGDPKPPASTSQPASTPASAAGTGVSTGEPASEPAADPQGGDWLLTLVNNNVPLPEGWSIETEVAEESNQKELAAVAAQAYRQMKQAAAAEGIDLLLCSGYRTVEYQENLFSQQKQKWLDKGYSEEDAYNEAKKVVAVPGYSEHNSGLAADIVTPKHQNLDDAFGDTDAAKWMFEHAPEYGFILRYPESKQAITGIIYEPWHYRYVGVENAKAITASGKCLEEYLDQNV